MGNKMVEGLASMNTSSKEITSDILIMDFTIVNACIVQTIGSDSDKWVQVDTGLGN